MTTPTKARHQIVRIMSRIDPGFTEKKCRNWTSIQLLNLAAMVVRHRQYLGVLEPCELTLLNRMEKLVRQIREVN